MAWRFHFPIRNYDFNTLVRISAEFHTSCVRMASMSHTYNVQLCILFVFSIILAPLLGQRIFMFRHMHECLTTVVILNAALNPSAAINDKSCIYVIHCFAYKFAIIVVQVFLTQGIPIIAPWQLK